MHTFPLLTHPTTLVNNDIHGLIKSVNDGTTSAFMWEWFTTKPWLDSGDVRFVRLLSQGHLLHVPLVNSSFKIGSVPTPWPSWLIAARPDASAQQLTSFLNALTKYVRDFDSADKRSSADIEFIKSTFGYPESDVKEWLESVSYPHDCLGVSSKVIAETLR